MKGCGLEEQTCPSVSPEDHQSSSVFKSPLHVTGRQASLNQDHFVRKIHIHIPDACKEKAAVEQEPPIDYQNLLATPAKLCFTSSSQEAQLI